MVGEYDIKVQAKDIFGVQSEWSEPHHIIMNDNDAPFKPTIRGPNKFLKARKLYEYTFVSFDPQGHELWYLIDWDDGHIDNWIGPYQSNEVVTLSHAWSKKGEYIPLEVKPGDKVLFTKYGPNEIKIEDKEYLIAKEEDILAILE